MPLSIYALFGRPSNVGVVDSCPLFSTLEPLVRGNIAAHSFMAYAERGETIWTVGSTSSFVAVVGSGAVRLTRTLAKSDQTLERELGPGMCFGLEAVSGKPHPTNAIAIDNTWYLKVPARLISLATNEDRR